MNQPFKKYRIQNVITGLVECVELLWRLPCEGGASDLINSDSKWVCWEFFVFFFFAVFQGHRYRHSNAPEDV